MTVIKIALTPKLKVLERNHRFALRTKQHNPGASGTLLAYEHAQKNLFDVLVLETPKNEALDSIQKIDWASLQTDNGFLCVQPHTDLIPNSQIPLRELELQQIVSPSAFELDLVAERKDQFKEEWCKLIEKDKGGISLRDWPDDLLTELLWEIAHQPPREESRFIRLCFDDDTDCDFPVGVLKPPNEQPSGDGQQLYLSMISNRHPEMDAMTHGSLFLNRETQLDGKLASLTEATKERTSDFLSRVPGNLQIHMFQTGLAAVVVGLWLGVIDARKKQTAVQSGEISETKGWNVIPRFFRVSKAVSSSQEAFARGRAW